MSAEFSPNIAMSILELELEIDSNPTPTAVHELVDLYSRAIEHYESVKDSKYMDFQNRMHSILSRPEILSLLQKYNVPEKPDTELPVPTVSHRRNHSASDITTESGRDQGLEEDKTEMVSPVVERRLNRIVKRHQNSVTHLASRTKQDLEVQDLSLERRLALRKNESLTRTMALASFEEDSLSTSDKNFELDLSYISEEEEPQEHPLSDTFGYEEKIEKIMERSFADKATRVADVRVKYAPQISELEEQGNIGMMVLKQMKVQMDKEIQAINDEIDSKRKEEILQLKKLHNLSSIA